MPDIPEDVATKAADIQVAFNADAELHRNNADLTPDGRIRRLAIAYLSAKAQMDELQTSWAGTSAINAETIDRDVFGAPNVVGADAISSRDAADRASRVESPEDGMRLLQQAERTGDEILARAVAQYAYDQQGVVFGSGWTDVVDAFASRRPEVAQKLTDLAAATRANLDASLTAAFTFSLARPAEFGNLTDYRLQILADTTDPSAPTQSDGNYGWLGLPQGLS
ncbi:hypothetical protein [Nocardioides sp. Iso805N]|uniref:hypothetical protein n=1 Tax=Nocardioides sp. Iso805N TaxID=1283287 RepID=UPI0003716B4D|nr:hypothetical protein [Nocardioides sp. Iso805N]